MSYAVYKTEAIVLRTIHVSEAHLDVVLFTKELGKITVRVQSARKQESKMRMFLTRYRSVWVDLVRGKLVWRLVGITGNPLPYLFKDESRLRPVYRMFRLAEFLIQGESPHPELFDFFERVLNSPASLLGEERVGGVSRPGEVARALEIFLIIKILDHLGYWNGTSLPEIADDALLETCLNDKKELVKKINESISATQIMIY